MSNSSAFNARILKEQKMFTFNPPPGVCVWPINNSIYEYHAEITGPEDSPYEDGIFELDLSVTNRYPFEPPKLRFITPIYHPNIDSTGRICLDLLKMPPAGNWQPSLNICVLLTSVRLLLSSPNPTDPLMVEISDEYLRNNSLYVKKAKEHTLQHAKKRVSVKRTQSNIETENDKKEVVPFEKKEKSDSQNDNESDSSSEASWSDFYVFLLFN